MQSSKYAASRAKSTAKKQKVYYQDASLTPTKTKPELRDNNQAEAIKVIIPNELGLCI